MNGVDAREETRVGLRADGRRRRGEPGHGLRVLVVEDDTLMSFALCDQLGDLGHAVAGVAASADRAVQLAAEEAPDLVLMDIRLSGRGDGIEAAERICARRPVAVIFLTGETNPDTLARARAFRPLGLLRKPATERELAALLALVAAGREA